jgi:hypothetical protein
VKGTVFVPQCLHGTRILDRGLDLTPVTHDARVAQQTLKIIVIEGCDGIYVKAGEGFAEVRPFVFNDLPAKA